MWLSGGGGGGGCEEGACGGVSVFVGRHMCLWWGECVCGRLSVWWAECVCGEV